MSSYRARNRKWNQQVIQKSNRRIRELDAEIILAQQERRASHHTVAMGNVITFSYNGETFTMMITHITWKYIEGNIKVMDTVGGKANGEWRDFDRSLMVNISRIDS